MFQKMLVRRWMESKNDIDPVQLMQLTRMMDFAMRSSYMYLFRNSYETYSTVMHNTKPDPVYVYHTAQFTTHALKDKKAVYFYSKKSIRSPKHRYHTILKMDN